MRNSSDTREAPAAMGARIARAHADRPADPPRLKINLYNGLETRAVARAVAELGPAAPVIDCLMVGDSYLTTHLGRESTRVTDPDEQRRVLAIMVDLVAEVDAERRSIPGPTPWLLADLPEGAAQDAASARASAERMARAGADAVKLEIGDAAGFGIVEDLTAAGHPVVAHIGYRPQHVANRKFGDDLEEALALLGEARRAREAGAVALVIERVAEPVAARLARPDRRELPIYAIFCGRAPFCGQSLNIFDACVKPRFAARAFPPTAVLEPDEYPSRYTLDLVTERFAALLRATVAGAHPRPAPSRLDAAALEALESADPWGAP